MRILFQGDSITDVGRDRTLQDIPNTGLGLGYPLFAAGTLLSKYPWKDFEFFNRGISGNRVVDLYARWKCDALNLAPDVISILIGVNDTWHEKAARNGVDLERYEFMYRELLKWTRQVLPDVKLVLCEPFVLNFGAVKDDWLEEIAARGTIVRALADEFDTLFVPLQGILNDALSRAQESHWLADGVHPTAAGHALIAHKWIKAVVSILGI